MTSFKAFKWSAIISLLAMSATSAIHAGWPGFVAAQLGTIGTALYLGATWLVVRLAGSAVSETGASHKQALIAFGALALKLPLIYLGWLAAKGLGPFGPPWFLAGLGLVYSLTIWRAAMAVRD